MTTTVSAPETTAVLSSGRRNGPLLPLRTPGVPVALGLAPPLKKRRKKRAPKPPKESRVRKAVVAAIALRAQGYSYQDAAKHLGLTYATVRAYVHQAKLKGWMTEPVVEAAFVDPADKIEFVLAHAAVTNLEAILKETKGESIGAGSLSDRALETSLEVAKGTGLLKTHQVVRGESTSQMGLALKVQVEMPSGELSMVRQGNVGGTPFFDAEIVEKEES